MTPEEMQTGIGKCGCGHPVRYQTHTGLACNKVARCEAGWEPVVEAVQTAGFQRDNLPRIAIIGADYAHQELRMMVTDRMHGVCEVISNEACKSEQVAKSDAKRLSQRCYVDRNSGA